MSGSSSGPLCSIVIRFRCWAGGAAGCSRLSLPAGIDRFRRRGAAGDEPATDHLARGDRGVLQCNPGHRAGRISARAVAGYRTRARQCRSHSDLPHCRPDSRLTRIRACRSHGVGLGHQNRRAVHARWNRLDASDPRGDCPAGHAADVARGHRRTVQGVHRASRGQIRASFAGVHVLLQARRQHGDGVIDAVLSRPRLQSH